MITDIEMTENSPASYAWTPVAIRQVLVEVLTEIQEIGGNSVPEFADELRIAVDLDRFDSLVAVDALTLLSERFDEDLPDDLLYEPKTQRPLRLDQVVERICEILAVKETTDWDK